MPLGNNVVPVKGQKPLQKSTNTVSHPGRSEESNPLCSVAACCYVERWSKLQRYISA